MRACNELGINEVPCKVKIYESDQQVVKDLLETNLRQRGIGNTNAIKLGRCIVELEKIYGIFNGNHKNKDQDNLNPKTQKDLANELEISQQQLSEYKKLLTLIPELQQLIETNQLSPTIGYKVLSKLSKEDQQKLIDDLGKDYISQLTQKKAEELATDIKENGLINPPVVTPEYKLIAGERRLKALKLLDYPQIEVRVMTVNNAEHQLNLEISENENRKEFTFSERIDWAKRLERIEKIKANNRQSELNGKNQLAQN